MNDQPNPETTLEKCLRLERQLQSVWELCDEAVKSVGNPGAWLLADKIRKATNHRSADPEQVEPTTYEVRLVVDLRDALLSVRQRIVARYLSSVDGGSPDLDLRLAIEEVDEVLALVQPAPPAFDVIPIKDGSLKRVWAVRCGACNTWLPEWNSDREEAEVILREHQDELHD